MPTKVMLMSQISNGHSEAELFKVGEVRHWGRQRLEAHQVRDVDGKPSPSCRAEVVFAALNALLSQGQVLPEQHAD